MDKFTPLFDDIIARYDLITAVVYGYIWRCCQMERGQCDASFQTIADDTGLSRKTVIRRLNVLVNDGVVTDTTPQANRKPHIYKLGSERPQKEAARVRETLELGSERPQTRVTVTHKDTKETEDTLDPLLELFEYFLMVSQCRRPNGSTSEAKMRADWFEPLIAIYHAAGDNFDGTKERIKTAIATLRDKGYTIANPGSIQNTAVAMQGNGEMEINYR